MSLRIGKVMQIHPEGYAADLVMLDDGSQVSMAQSLSHHATGNSGSNHMDVPTPPASGNMQDVTETNDRDIYAVTAMLGGRHLIIGYLHPQVSQMLFTDQNRHINRHPSDVYTSIDNDGNFELYHPSGTYVRIGTDPAHEDLTGKDFDGKWKIAQNTDKAVHVHVGFGNAGTSTGSIDVDPSGNVVLTSPQVTLSGNLIVNGSISVPSGDVVASGISEVNHVHGGVQPGGADTDKPV